MSITQWDRINELFIAAMDLDIDAQEQYLLTHCGDDAQLRDEVQQMLESHRRDDRFLTPLRQEDLLAAGGIRYATLEPGAPIGQYEMVRLIATGGMGEVYLARRADAAFEQQVAIKVIRRSVATVSMYERFNIERQALANLEHPNISRLLDGGTTDDGLPYFVMEYIHGLPLIAYCDENDLNTDERLKLFRCVCDAVGYAHQNLVVHRDIKPSNILVTDDGTVKLLDFGIARLLDAEPEVGAVTATVTHTSAMTPEYCSPEQVRGELVTTATDVYSLGVVLYELLTARRPFSLRNIPRYEADRLICEMPPVAPSVAVMDAGEQQLSTATSRLRKRELKGDLDTIILKALQKQPARRYTSVEQLIDDLDRHARGLPVHAQRDTMRYRAGKFYSRNKPQAIAAMVATLALIAAMIGIIVGFVQVSNANQIVIAERQDAQGSVDVLEHLLASASPFVRGREATVADLLIDAELVIERRLTDRPGAEANVRLALARTHRSLFMYAGAIPHLQQALAYYEQHPNEHELNIAECLTLLGRSKADLSFTGEADPSGVVEMQRRALAIRRRHYGKEHALIAESLHDLGLAMWAQRHPRGADQQVVDHLRAAIDMYSRLGSGNSHEAADVHVTLGHALFGLNDATQAERHYRAAVHIYSALPEPADQFALNALEALARLLRATGRPGEAFAVLSQYRAQCPLDAALPSSTTALWDLLVLQIKHGPIEELEPVLVDVLRVECRIMARKNPAQAGELDGPLNQLRLGPGNFDRAATYVDILSVLMLHQSPPHPGTGVKPLSVAMLAVGVLDDANIALTLHQQVIDRVTGSMTDNDPRMIEFMRARPLLEQRRDAIQPSRRGPS